ncbi:MAG: hypothetical protein COB04_08070 [Gammaproteobacteria bacterium]|nr:MAG: hypothetical protein COB04_08070 [Gammaproteobacteria bacterium]
MWNNGLSNRPFLLLLILFFYAVNTYGFDSAARISEVTDQNNDTAVHVSSDYLIDRNSAYSLEDILSPEIQGEFSPNPHKIASFGFTDASIWLKFTYVNHRTAQLNNPILLDVGYPPLDHIEIYRPSAEGYQQYLSGSLNGFSSRELKHRNFLFYLPETLGRPITVYLKIKSQTPIIIPLTIKSFQYIQGADKYEAYVLIALLSIFATLFLYNISMSFTLNEKSLYFYQCFLAGVILPLGFLTGVTEGLLGESVAWPATEFWFYVNIAIIFYTLFVSEILDSRKNMPKAIFAERALITWFACIAAATIFTDIRFWQTGLISIIPMAVYLCTALTYGVILKQRAAYVALVAWTPSIIAVLVWTFSSLNVIPMSWWTLNGIYFGLAFSSILLSISLSDKVTQARKQMYLLEKSSRIELEQNNLALQKSNGVKETFLSTISHELRTPLNGIVGSLSLLENIINELALKTSNKLTLSLKYHLEQTNRSSSEMLALINNIIDFTELNTGRICVNSEYFTPYKIMHDALNKSLPEIRGKHIEIRLDIDVLSTIEIHSDPILYTKVFEILIENASKFTSKGIITISALLESASQDSATLHIKIKDTGIGIPDKKIEEITQPFHQVDQSIRRKHGGLGIGLSVCKKILAVLDASIEIHSGEAQGTEVCLQFNITQFRTTPKQATINPILPLSVPLPAPVPLQPTPAPSTQLSNSSQNQQPLTSASAKPKAANDATLNVLNEPVLVLIVEDNKTNQMVAQSIVKKLGMIPVLAEDGSIALEILQQKTITYILMDCQMPVMDGFEATRRIRELDGPNAKLPIIAVTANSTENDRRACMACGMDDFIAKPITVNILTEKLKTWDEQHPPIAS